LGSGRQDGEGFGARKVRVHILLRRNCTLTCVSERLEIERNGRIDLYSELNDAQKHPDGSYSALEHALLKLGLVAGSVMKFARKISLDD
jgi:hypothetical protein